MVDSKQKLSISEIERLDGHYDKDGFYLLREGGFYDPLGFHFNKDGQDAQGGSYDEQGIYCAAAKVPQRLR
jgi:hypothetical protein